MSGKKAARIQGRGFFNFLSNPEVQSGQPPAHGLPADHHGGLRADRQVGFYKENPGTDTSP